MGPLRMALPVGPGTDASVLAAQAVATEVSRVGSAGLTVEDARSAQVTSTIAALRAEAPQSVDGSAPRTLADRRRRLTPRGRACTPCPITEQALYSATQRIGAPGVGILPTGYTPSADFPVVDLTAPRSTPRRPSRSSAVLPVRAHARAAVDPHPSRVPRRSCRCDADDRGHLSADRDNRCPPVTRPRSPRSPGSSSAETTSSGDGQNATKPSGDDLVDRMGIGALRGRFHPRFVGQRVREARHADLLDPARVAVLTT